MYSAFSARSAVVRLTLRRRKCQHAGVDVEVLPCRAQFGSQRFFAEEWRPRLWSRQLSAEFSGTVHARLARYQKLHRLFRFDPRAARAAPSRACRQRYLESQLIGSPKCIGNGLLPTFAHEPLRATRNPDVNFEIDPAPNSRVLHRVEIGGHSLGREMAVHEIPIDPRPRLIWRIHKVRMVQVDVVRREREERIAKTDSEQAHRARLQKRPSSELRK